VVSMFAAFSKTRGRESWCRGCNWWPDEEKEEDDGAHSVMLYDRQNDLLILNLMAHLPCPG